ncbi:MAG TPA: TIGR02466 family protein [Rhizomicrobium sp.]|nr:TIGR02466 family protein [Rhizomicrobium sp.]
MARFQTLFPTLLYSGRITPPRGLEETCLAIAAEDKAGQRWSKEHGYGGYTSYSSLNDLTARATVFAELERALAREVALFARKAEFDLGRKKLRLDSLWINVMNKGAVHAPHIHPHSVVSGTYYVAVPPRSGAIRFEDPRLSMLMAAPAKKAKARIENRFFVDVTPKPGLLLLWESWLRHGVEANGSAKPRISVSFNYQAE